MRHARSDYDPIIDPRPDGIPDDEPVFLLRAQDIVAPLAVMRWADDYETLEGADPEVAAAVRRHAEAMEEWQAEHGRKVPDVPDGALE